MYIFGRPEESALSARVDEVKICKLCVIVQELIDKARLRQLHQLRDASDKTRILSISHNNPLRELLYYTMEAAAKTFFASKYFAVAGPQSLIKTPKTQPANIPPPGASQNTSKFGYKILAWYHAHSLPVTPLNPSRPSITVGKTQYPTVASPSELLHPTETGLSIITQPSVTKQLLKEAKEAGVRAVWLQPGSFDPEGLEYAVREFKAGVGGEGGGGGEGWCVLIDGEEAMSYAGEEGKERL